VTWDVNFQEGQYSIYSPLRWDAMWTGSRIDIFVNWNWVYTRWQ